MSVGPKPPRFRRQNSQISGALRDFGYFPFRRDLPKKIPSGGERRTGWRFTRSFDESLPKRTLLPEADDRFCFTSGPCLSVIYRLAVNGSATKRERGTETTEILDIGDLSMRPAGLAICGPAAKTSVRSLNSPKGLELAHKEPPMTINYKAYTIEAFEREAGRWRATIKRLDGKKISVTVTTPPTKHHSVTTTADTLTREAAVDLAKQGIDGGGMT
jgi:hypothetical protein